MTDASTVVDWGPLGEPIHGPVPEGKPPWKDNAYLAFWSPDREVFGVLHVSTSPNAEGRRARFSLSVGGRAIEVIEDLDVGTWSSESITFTGGSDLQVESQAMSASIEMAPIFAMADYTAGQVIPPLVAGEPLRHYEQAVEVTGTVRLDGTETTFSGHGIRDRSWGYRDESANFQEYIGLLAVFPDHAVSCLRFLEPGGGGHTEGHVLSDSENTQLIDGISVTRNASGLLAKAELKLETGQELVYESGPRRAGFWVPMGWTRKGPAMSSYDEFIPVTAKDGTTGFALVEHGIIRQLF